MEHETTRDNDVESHRNGLANFFSFHFDSSVMKILQDWNITIPSRIQELAIAQLLKKANKKKHFCIGAQTGTGKTLAYLLPILSKMKHLEKMGHETQAQRPKVLIVAPTRELASQIYKTAKHLSHSMKFRTVLLRSDLAKSRMKRDLHTNIDVVVTTPTIFNELHSEGHVYFSDLRFVVLDEADTLCGKDFLQELEKIVVPCLQRGKHVNEFVQFGFVFATYNANIERFINHYFSQDAFAFHLSSTDRSQKNKTFPSNDTKHLEEQNKNFTTMSEGALSSSQSISTNSPPPNMLYIIDKDIHKATLHIQHKFIPMTNNKDKMEYLLERVLKLKNHSSTMTTAENTHNDKKSSSKTKLKSSVNTIKNSALIQSLGLQEEAKTANDKQLSMNDQRQEQTLTNGLSNALPLSPLRERILIFCNTVKSCRAVYHALTKHGLEASCFHGDMPHERQAEEFDSFSSGRLNIMVTTDIASRGLDIANPVDHVVMFDFPLNSIDYMHRAGRTGRMRQLGKVTSLLNRKKEAALAKVIEYSIITKQPLTNVNVENAIEMYETLKLEHHKKKQKQGEEFAKKRGKFGTRSTMLGGKISISNPTKLTKQASRMNKQ
nr:unnamed protein product [Naegleria fowleri]